MQFKHILYSILAISFTYAQTANVNSAQTTQLIKKGKDKFEMAKNAVTPTAEPQKNKLTIAQATLKAINSARAKNQVCGRATTPLKWNEKLYVFAKEHSIDMAVTSKLSHDGSGTKTDKTAIRLKLNRGSHFFERVNQKVNSKRVLSGELLVRSKRELLRGPKELVEYWLKNPKDCKVIMDSRFTDVALAKVISNKDDKAYWTLLFADAKPKK